MTPDGKLSLEGVERVPYRLPELLQGIEDSKPIVLLEGEKDADRVAEMGFVATTFVGGTGKWRDEYLEYFRDAHIVLVPDNDQPGIKGMQDIAEQLHGTAKNIKVLELPGLGERKEKHGKDFSDWADIDGNDQKKLNELISDAPEWSPLEVYDENLAVVEELNLKHFVTMIGGKTTVVNEVHDPAMERNILTYSTPTDFKNYYSNKFITIDDRPVSIGHHWFKHPLRRQFPGITFMPGETSPYMGNYNLWKGFNVSPKAFKDNILRQARLEAIDQGETDDEILWCCLSVNQEFVDFLDIQKVNPSTQPPTGRGKKATPELHKVIWRAYRFASTTIAENPSAQEVWDSLRADPMMFDPKRILIEDQIDEEELWYIPHPETSEKKYSRNSLNSMLSRLKKIPPKI